MKYYLKDDTSDVLIEDAPQRCCKPTSGSAATQNSRDGAPVVVSPSPSILKKNVNTPTRTTAVMQPSASSRSPLANKNALRNSKVVSFQSDVSLVTIQPTYELVLEHNSTVVVGDDDSDDEFYLTLEEVLKLLWFTPEEYHRAFKDAKQEEQRDEQEYEYRCLRGIPAASGGANRKGRRTLKQRRENSKEVRLSVLFDQKFLRESGINGADLLLAGRYSRRCVTSKHEALLIGLRHARDVVDNDLLSRKTTILKQQEHFACIRGENHQPQEPPQLLILTRPQPHDDFKTAAVTESQEKESKKLQHHNEKSNHVTNNFSDNHIHHRRRRKRYLRRANMLLSLALAS